MRGPSAPGLLPQVAVLCCVAVALVAAAAGVRRRRRRRGAHLRGLRYVEDVVTEAEAAALVAAVEALAARGARGELRGPTYAPVPPAFAARRQSRVMLQFGAYTSANRVENVEVEPVPAALARVAERLVDRGVFSAAEAPTSVCVNMFEEGQWLPAHVDNGKFARPFATVSLVSRQRVVFASLKNPSHPKTTIHLAVGSALRVDGDAADEWTHEILPVSARRISLTFRRFTAETRARYDAELDARERAYASKGEKKRAAKAAKRETKKKKKKPALKQITRAQEEDAPSRDEGRSSEETAKARSQRSTPYDVTAEEVEGGREETPTTTTTTTTRGAGSSSRYARPAVEVEHVQKVYDCVAAQWHGTRYKAWPRVADFVTAECAAGALVCDVGCGNGKNASACAEARAHCIACDFSLKLVEIAQREARCFSYDCLGADALTLPIRSQSMDAAICIAVLHHISTPERRLRVVAETMRIVRPGGAALFYAWAHEQRDFESRSGHRFETADVLVPFHFRTHGEYFDDGALRRAPAHAARDDRKKALVLQRFCHVYAEGELEDLILQLAKEKRKNENNDPGPDHHEVRVRHSYYDQGNWAVVVDKVASSSS